jgi:hypothetical protein
MMSITHLDPAIQRRIRMERSIARAFVTSAHKMGFTFQIDNGGDDDEIVKTSGVKQTLDEMFATDEERVYLVKDGKRIGWVFFVYGNSGYDVICDYTVNLDDLGVLKTAEKRAERLGN